MLTRATLQPGDFVELDHDHSQALIQAFRAAGAQGGTVVIAPKHRHLVWGNATHALFAALERPNKGRELTLRQILGPIEGDYIHRDDIPDKATHDAILALAKDQDSRRGQWINKNSYSPFDGIYFRKNAWIWVGNSPKVTTRHPSDYLIEDGAPAPSSPFPPPGTKCEVLIAGEWERGRMVGIDSRDNAVVEVYPNSNSASRKYSSRSDPNEVRVPVDKRQRAIDHAREHLNIRASEIVGRLYDAGLLKDPEE